MSVTPGAALGYGFVVVSGRLPLVARILMLPVLATGSAVAWLGLVDPVNLWRPAIMVLSFAATLGTGAICLVREAQKRRARRTPPVVWPNWYPPARPR
ncbi:hypothetical protein [Streptomyces sp. NPDC051183]|uniref:hypothetical protein n=1 Tax=Streptomyces sp. NPDC051183 TaxID=3155165 RepID=UPI00343DDA28